VKAHQGTIFRLVGYGVALELSTTHLNQATIEDAADKSDKNNNSHKSNFHFTC